MLGVKWLGTNGMTRENYLNLAYGENRPARLGAEQEMQLPPEIRLRLG